MSSSNAPPEKWLDVPLESSHHRLVQIYLILFIRPGAINYYNEESLDFGDIKMLILMMK